MNTDRKERLFIGETVTNEYSDQQVLFDYQLGSHGSRAKPEKCQLQLQSESNLVFFIGPERSVKC